MYLSEGLGVGKTPMDLAAPLVAFAAYSLDRLSHTIHTFNPFEEAVRLKNADLDHLHID